MNKEFKLIVAGTRGFNNSTLLAQEITMLVSTTYAEREVSIVSGMAPWRLTKVPRLFPWDLPLAALVSPPAPEELCNFADGLLAFWDGESRSTKHLIEYMQKLGKPVHVSTLPEEMPAHCVGSSRVNLPGL